MSSSSFKPSGPLRGSLRPPPDKSISHRSAIFAAMSEGRTEVTAYLDSADTRSTLGAVEALGATVEIAGPSDAPGGLDVTIDGIGLEGPAHSAGVEPVAIDVGNAGTLLRLLPGWLAGQPGGIWSLAGDESIARRPVDRVAIPLRAMGARATAHEDRLPPLVIAGSPLQGVEHRLKIASAQVKSCLLIAGLLAEGKTCVVEPSPSRDHTERMLAAAGAVVISEPLGTDITLRGTSPGRRISIEPADRIETGPITVPGDFSSAAFHIVAALIVPGSEVRLESVNLNPTRIGLLGVLNRMGAAITVEEGPAIGGEPRGTIVARSGPLQGTRVAAGEVALAIDELPLVGLAGAFAEGETVVREAGELRHKESDRITAVVESLRALGAEVEELEDGFTVTGTGALRGGGMDSGGDHRLAMIGAIAGLASKKGVDVAGMKAAGVSYPGFEADLATLTS